VSVTFVLGGGGPLGAHEVGMVHALIERGIRPSVVLGTPVGAINGAAVVADPTVAGVERLTEMWSAIDRADVRGGSVLGRPATPARTRTHLHDNCRRC
jgi:NTE family protein